MDRTSPPFDRLIAKAADRDHQADGQEWSGQVLSPGAFFDRQDVLEQYREVRDDPDAPVRAIEWPIIRDMIGRPEGRQFLDLGCGNAWTGRYLLERGASRYFGLDVSHHLLDEARLVLAGTTGEVQFQDLEWWCGGRIGLFDDAISRLALQYVRNIGKVLEVVRHHLRPGGLFVFSVEHPVLTSTIDRQARKPPNRGGPLRDYFREGPRSDAWLGAAVCKHHRSIETYFEQITQHGFHVDRFSEGRPAPENFNSVTSYEAYSELPMCILFRCTRD